MDDIWVIIGSIEDVMRIDIPLEIGIPDTISRGKRAVLEREAEFIIEKTEGESLADVAGKSCNRW